MARSKRSTSNYQTYDSDYDPVMGCICVQRGMSISEIAIVLGTSRGSVKNTLSSALKKLSKIERLKKLYEP